MDIVLGKVGAAIAEKVGGDAGSAAPKGQSFQDVLSGADDGAGATDLSSSLGLDTSDLSSGMGQFNAISAEGVTVDPSKVSGAANVSGSDKVVSMLNDVNKGQMQMDGLLNDVLYSGKKFSNQELLVIQAQIHHFSEMTELTVKVAEQAVNNVRQIQNTQV